MSRDARVAIVTGASRGIGRATAIRLAQDFDRIAIVGRDLDALADSADTIRAGGAAAMPLSYDLRRPEATAAVVAAAVGEWQRIDAVVNVAGAVPQSPLLSMTDGEWDDGIALKLHGARRLALAAWQHLCAAKGSLVFISGATAAVPKASLAGVSTINAAIVAMAKAFADLGLPHGVRVNSVQPGAVLTGRRLAMIARFAGDRGLPIEQALIDYAREAGIARYGEPEDIAELIAFILSPRSRWMTGSSLRIDGGEVRSV